MEFDSKKLDIGSRVLITNIVYGTRRESIGTVVKITPSGLIDVKANGGGISRYRRNGTKFSSDLYSGSRSYLTVATVEDEERVKAEQTRLLLSRKLETVAWTNYDLDKLERVMKILTEG